MGKGKSNFKRLQIVLLVTIVLSFSVLILGGLSIFKASAPQPGKIVDTNGNVLATYKTIKGGQAVYEKYGLMDYGSLLGHGSYLGPDYTAEALHVYAQEMQKYYAKKDYKQSFKDLKQEQQSVIKEKVIREARKNRYDKETDTLTLTDAQVAGFNKVKAYYQKEFKNNPKQVGLSENMISEEHMSSSARGYVAKGNQIDQMASFFFWSAWLSSTERPGEDYTYTNNWPYDPDVGNEMSYASMLWTGVSVAGLVLGVGIILYYYNRYKFHMEDAYEPGKFPKLNVENYFVTPSQRKTVKYFFVVMLLFMIQSLLGGFLAHYYVEGNAFFGIKLVEWLPFNIAKGWHLQLAIFWIATAWLAMGIYVAPMVGGKEPKYQGLLVDILFWALIVLVGGSMIGEWFGVKGYLGDFWWLFGHYGWEYIELGKIWQIVLVIGMLIWLYIVTRGLWNGLRKERRAQEKGGLVHLLFYSSIAVPAFYFFAFFIQPDSHITYADYWRWWIIHLWVEGIFEVFAVVVIGFLMVSMGLVTKKSTVRALYFQLTLLLGSGVIGIGHHYYWIGSNEAWLGLGSVFSAIEVIPLTLLIAEAYDQYRMMKEGGQEFPYKGAFYFLISTAVWNAVGAGVLGFLINTPAVSYFEHGSYLTPAHGHGAMFGVYGMFSIAIALYALRNLIQPTAWNEKLTKWSCILLNAGLAGMLLITLLPVGFMQFKEAYTNGFWSARALEFYQQDSVHLLLWLRMIPDTVFLAGIVPLIILFWKGIRNIRSVNKAD
ncbi:MAG: nitric-oxide reductase large subunit [Ectobacillus sp.]